MKNKSICVLTSHYLLSDKQANIHYIFTILSKYHNVDWVTYPVSLSLLHIRNRYKIKALLKGWLVQHFIFNILPKHIVCSRFLRALLAFDIIGGQVKKKKYDILLVEGVQSAYIYNKIRHDKLILRMSDDIGYLDLSCDQSIVFNDLVDEADQVWSVLKASSFYFDNSVYLPNPSIHKDVVIREPKAGEAVYVGSNKFDHHLVEKLADTGIVIHIYSELNQVVHDNIFYHGLLPKNELVNEISMYKVGIIPFYQDEKNIHMEIPLKTYDYLAAGLHVVMISSSRSIDTSIINLTSTHDEFIDTVYSLLNEDVDIEKCQQFIDRRNIGWFESAILTQLDDLDGYN